SALDSMAMTRIYCGTLEGQWLLRFPTDILFLIAYFLHCLTAKQYLVTSLTSYTYDNDSQNIDKGSHDTNNNNSNSNNKKKKRFMTRRSKVNRAVRIFFSLAYIALAMLDIVPTILRGVGDGGIMEMTGELQRAGATKIDYFFCTGGPELFMENGQMMSFTTLTAVCRVPKARFMIMLVVMLLALVEIRFYWVSDIGTLAEKKNNKKKENIGLDSITENHDSHDNHDNQDNNNSLAEVKDLDMEAK
ncbi:hypothetical protein BGZ83_003896, partial [Gryganskiella cystojenkinii]